MNREKQLNPDDILVVVAEAEDADGQDVILHLRLKPEFHEKLNTVVGWMMKDPAMKNPKTRERLSYAGAIRYSLRHILANPPSHVEPVAR